MADWSQTFTILAVFIGAFLYMMNRMDANQRENNRRFEGVNKRFEGMDKRFNGIENRMISMEAEIKNTNQRLTDLKTDINQRLSTIEGYLVPRKVFRFEEPHHDPDEPKEN